MTERLTNVTVVRPIVLGSYAFLLQQGASEKAGSMFRWSILLRSATDPSENMSYYIRSVEFTLHSTFAQPKRICDQPPYQVTETGWGEFEILVKVFFHDSQERPIELRHFLKLRPDIEVKNNPSFDHFSTPVVKEQYDEILFHNPHEWFYEKLIRPPPEPLPAHNLLPFFKQYDDQAEYERLTELQTFLRTNTLLQAENLMMLDHEFRAQKELLIRSST
jgi:YEATS domain-containing protein 4